MRKAYIEYSYPDPNDAAVVEAWSTPNKPKKSKAKSGCIFVYELIKNTDGKEEATNERLWDGVE